MIEAISSGGPLLGHDFQHWEEKRRKGFCVFNRPLILLDKNIAQRPHLQFMNVSEFTWYKLQCVVIHHVNRAAIDLPSHLGQEIPKKLLKTSSQDAICSPVFHTGKRLHAALLLNVVRQTGSCKHKLFWLD